MAGQTLVSQYMSKTAFTIAPSAKVNEAKDTLERNNIRHLPVVTAGGHICGIISDRDLLVPQNVASNLAVDQIMATTTFVVRPTDSLAEAGQLLKKHRIGALPVVSDLQEGNVIGIVSYLDILRAYIERYAINRPRDDADVGVDRDIIEQWEERLGVPLPDRYREDVLENFEGRTVFNYCIPNWLSNLPGLIAFARWNDVIYAFDTQAGESYSISAVTAGLAPEKIADCFDDWLQTVIEAEKKPIASE